jgi:hypothetical protein
MNRLCSVLALIFGLFILGSLLAYGGNPDVITASKHDTSPPLSQLAQMVPKFQEVPTSSRRLRARLVLRSTVHKATPSLPPLPAPLRMSALA